MKKAGYIFSIIGTIIIIVPEIIGYLIGGILLFIGINIIFFNLSLKKSQENSKTGEKKEFFKFGNYTIYK